MCVELVLLYVILKVGSDTQGRKMVDVYARRRLLDVVAMRETVEDAVLTL